MLLPGSIRWRWRRICSLMALSNTVRPPSLWRRACWGETTNERNRLQTHTELNGWTNLMGKNNLRVYVFLSFVMFSWHRGEFKYGGLDCRILSVLAPYVYRLKLENTALLLLWSLVVLQLKYTAAQKAFLPLGDALKSTNGLFKPIYDSLYFTFQPRSKLKNHISNHKPY